MIRTNIERKIMKEISGFESQDIADNKIIAALSYIVFFLPLLACPNSKFGKFHANQAFWLFVVGAANSLVVSRFPLFGGLLAFVIGLLLFVLTIYLIITAYNGKALELPVLGNIVIFK